MVRACYCGARKTLDLAQYREQLEAHLGKGRELMRIVVNKAKANPKRIACGEGEEPKVIRAALQVQDEGIGYPILLGHHDIIQQKIKELGLGFRPTIISPADGPTAPNHERYVSMYHQLRERKGITRGMTGRNHSFRSPRQGRGSPLAGGAGGRQVPRKRRWSKPPPAHRAKRVYYGPMMVRFGDADAYVSGLNFNYPDVIRPALQIVHTRAGVKKVAGMYIVITKDQRIFFFTDATANIDPSAEDLAEIAILASDAACNFDVDPRVAMLSFSNFGSTPHPFSERVRRAVELVCARRPDLPIDGEMQAGTAVVAKMLEERYPCVRVREPNVLVFPNLESANIAYKLARRLGDAETIGPILLGMR